MKKISLIASVFIVAALSMPRATAAEFGAAKFNDRCSAHSEIIGHPVPPYTAERQGIVNDYPIAAVINGTVVQIGDVYPTVSGVAYFVPTAAAFRRGLTTASDASSLPVGPNGWLRGAALDPRVATKVRPMLKVGIVQRFLIATAGKRASCYTSDWDGKIPRFVNHD